MTEDRVIEVKRKVLSKNDELAAGLRARLADMGITCLNFVSSPGSGKTTLLVRTIAGMKERMKIAVLEGDQETDNDARKIAATGAPVIQINTGSACHLDAQMVSRGLDKLVLDGS